MGCLVLVGKDLELDAVGGQFEPYPYHQMRLHAGGALESNLEYCRTREAIETESGKAVVILTPKECHSLGVTLFGGHDYESRA